MQYSAGTKPETVPDHRQHGCQKGRTMSDAAHQEFSVEFRPTSYDGYRSFSYLKPGEDYEEFKLAKEFGRVPLHDMGLDETQVERTRRLIDENIIISLHDHPQIFPEDMNQVR